MKTGSIGQTINNYESSVNVNAEPADSNTEDESETSQAQEITKTEHFGLIAGTNDSNGHISYAGDEQVVAFVQMLLNKRQQEPFMDITPNPSQDFPVDDNNQMDDKNSNANKKHKSIIEDTSSEINHTLDETAILGAATPTYYEMQKITKTEELGLMSPMEVKGTASYAKNPIVFQYVRGLLKNPKESFIDVTNPKHKKRKSTTTEGSVRKRGHILDEAPILEAITPPDDEIKQIQENPKAEKLDLIETHMRGNGLLYANSQMMAKCAHLLERQLREPLMDITRSCSQEFLVSDNNRKTNKNMGSTIEGPIPLRRAITL